MSKKLPATKLHDPCMTKNNDFRAVNTYHEEENKKEATHHLASAPVHDAPERRPVLTGVDTVRLYMPFSIIGGTELRFRRPPAHKTQKAKYYNRVLWKQDDGKPIRGLMATWRDDDIKVRIAGYNSQPVYCWVTASLPKVIYGHNARVLNKREYQNALAAVEERLYEIGVQVDIESAKLSRLDICRDSELARPSSVYMALLEIGHFNYQRRRLNYASGIVRGNNSTQLGIYDKEIELRNQSKRRACEIAPHTVRIEMRLMNSRAVKRSFDLERAVDLYHLYDELADWLDQRIEREFFGNYQKVLDKTKNIGTKATAMETMHQSAKIKASASALLLSDLCNAKAAARDCERVVAQFGIRSLSASPEREALYEELKLHLPAKKYSAIVRRLDEQRLYALLQENHEEGVPFQTLYQEIRECCLARFTGNLQLLPVPFQGKDNVYELNEADEQLSNEKLQRRKA